MSEIHDFMSEVNSSNSTNSKVLVLRKFKDSEIVARVLKMTYDKVRYTYGVTLAQVLKFSSEAEKTPLTLTEALDQMESLVVSRKLTGHAAYQHIAWMVASLEPDDSEILKKVIDRDLRINLGRTQINKVFGDLITKPAYMRCDLYSNKTAKTITFPAILQLKADGTYREFSVDSGVVTCRSRSGESYEYPLIFDELRNLDNGVYVGELTVLGVPDRAEANGLINSDNPPHEKIVLSLWDYIEHSEYRKALAKDKKRPCVNKYSERFGVLQDIDFAEFRNINLIPHKTVWTIREALEQTSEWMRKGLEGSILKDWSGVFKDGTSKYQLKLKLEVECELRVVGFIPGTPGTKRDGKIGALVFQNDEGTIKGRTSGFDDKTLDHFTENWNEINGKVISVRFNDLSKSDDNDYWALMHPRFVEIRNDKDETDTLETVKKLREMALEFND